MLRLRYAGSSRVILIIPNAVVIDDLVRRNLQSPISCLGLRFKEFHLRVVVREPPLDVVASVRLSLSLNRVQIQIGRDRDFDSVIKPDVRYSSIEVAPIAQMKLGVDNQF